MLRRLSIAALLLGLTTSGASAATLGQKGTRFGLEMGRYQAQLDYGTAVMPVTIGTVFVYFTEPLSPNLDLGMDLGRVFMVPRDNPTSSGSNPAGYLVGLWGQYRWSPLRNLDLALHLSGRYHEAMDGSDPNRRVSFEWQEYGAGLLAAVRLSMLELSAGPLWQDLSGTQHNDGLSPGTWRFVTDPGLQWRLQADLLVSNGGRVGLRLEQETADPAHRRVSISFETRY